MKLAVVLSLGLVIAFVAGGFAAEKSGPLDFKMKSIDGKDVALSKYKGDVLLIVNVASKCGLTPQYEQLEAVYTKYKDQGLNVLGFPANEFGKQEPGTNDEIAKFCSSKYSVDFPMFAKIVVKGNVVMEGYFRDPEATARAFHGGWFHSGDAAVVHPDGYVEIRDRLKDVIISGGENISSMEVENEINAHPAVLECAVVPAKAADAEDEVFAIVVPKPDARLDPADLVRFLAPRLPHFMVPRYVEIATHLPKTPTGKIQKYPLRERGVTSAAWDRVAAGLRLRDLVSMEKTA